MRFLQLLAAATWVGGMIVLGAVAGPAARLAGDRAAARRVVTSVWRRFGVIGTLAGVVLIATGSAYPRSGFCRGGGRGREVTKLPHRAAFCVASAEPGYPRFLAVVPTCGSHGDTEPQPPD